MADCDETLHQLYSYLDELLDEDMRNAVADHLENCGDCQKRADFEYSLMIHVRARAKEEPIPDDLRRRLLECFDIDVSDDARRNGD